MRVSIGIAPFAAAVVFVTSPLAAQTVEAGVVVHSGPITGHVLLGEPPPVVYEVPVREVVVVEHVHVPHGNANGWWKNHGYRPVSVYYDGDAYYRRRFEGKVELREVVIYEREGRYYDAWEDRHHGHGHHERDDRRGNDDD